MDFSYLLALTIIRGIVRAMYSKQAMDCSA